MKKGYKKTQARDDFRFVLLVIAVRFCFFATGLATVARFFGFRRVAARARVFAATLAVFLFFSGEGANSR